MGAPLSAFQTAHPPQTSPNDCPQGGCYGNHIAPAYVGVGQCCEFVDLSTTGPPDSAGRSEAVPLRSGAAIADCDPVGVRDPELLDFQKVLERVTPRRQLVEEISTAAMLASGA